MDMKQMLKVMMKDMRKMKGIMSGTSKEIEEAKGEARVAELAAAEAKAAAVAVEKDVDELKHNSITKENV